MVNSAIIELAIGLTFVFSLLSILVTQINNIIVRILNLKAERLKDQLDVTLSDPVVRAKLMTHPLIGMIDTEFSKRILRSDERLTEEIGLRLTEKQRANVDFIPTDTFVDVLVDVLTENVGKKLYEALDKVVDKMEPSVEKSLFRQLLREIQLTGTGLEQLRMLIDKLEDPETKRQMLVALNLVDAALDKLQAENSDLIPLLLGIRQIKDKYLETSLMAILNTASNISDARKKIGAWFDSSMQRASKKYIEQMQQITLLISFLIALLLNVDTLHMGRVLWEDPTLRNAVAETAVATAPQIIQDFENQADPTTGDGTIEEVQQSISAAEATLETLLELRLPIGWVFEPEPETPNDEISLRVDRLDPRNLWKFSPTNNPDGWLGLLILKIMGIGMTTVALAQGAPFWFDMIRKLTGGRGSNPETKG